METARSNGAAARATDTLTERERQTLRLLLAGHDAKSIARELDLSVHTINERLRDARRKLSVSSSREAARLLHASEQLHPETRGDKRIGDEADTAPVHAGDEPGAIPRQRRWGRRATGGVVMIAVSVLILGLLVPGQQQPNGASADAVQTTPSAAANEARRWLELVDRSAWEESWKATAATFRSLNTLAAWRAASERAREPLGAVLLRTLVNEQDTPAPPNGYRTVQFRTDYANHKGATETVSLERSAEGWKVVGCYIE